MRKLLVAALTFAALAVPGSSSPSSSSQAWSSNWFQSPSGNIRCRYFGDSIACTTLSNGRVAVATLSGSAYWGYYNYSFPGGPVLYYGQYYNVPGRFRCLSRSDGMYCLSLYSGHGFGIAREFVRTY